MEIKRIQLLTKKAKEVYVYVNVTKTESVWFKITKKEVMKFLNKNKWWIGMDTINTRLDKRNKLWIG